MGKDLLASSMKVNKHQWANRSPRICPWAALRKAHRCWPIKFFKFVFRPIIFFYPYKSGGYYLYKYLLPILNLEYENDHNEGEDFHRSAGEGWDRVLNSTASKLGTQLVEKLLCYDCFVVICTSYRCYSSPSSLAFPVELSESMSVNINQRG